MESNELVQLAFEDAFLIAVRAETLRPVFGVGPAVDQEDGAKGFGAHSDQERILESELYRFVRFHYAVVAELAGSD